MKVLLLYPEFPDTFWSFKHALKFIAKKASSPPLGLMTVASLLPKDWELRLIDLNVRPLKKDDLHWADMALVSAMTVQRDSARHMLARCKNAGIKVVAGGPLFTSEYDMFPEVDHFVLNEAELTLPSFLDDFQQGRPDRFYTSSEFPDLRLTPPPQWHLADLERYAAMSIQYSRGCPYHCDFCNVTSLFGHRVRTKSAAQIIAELDALYELGWRDSVFFVDDNLIGNNRELKQELLPALIRWQQKHRRLSFYTEASINLADDPELVRLMVEAGFYTVFIGIETPDEEALEASNKAHNRGRDLLEDIKKLQRAGLQVQAGFIVGFDSDSPSIFQRQVEFIQKSGIVTAMVGLLQAPRGTRLYERMKQEDRLLGDSSGDNVGATTNIMSKMDSEVLREGYHNLLRTIYSPKNVAKRIMTFLHEYQLPEMRARPGFQHKMAFFRSLYQLGIVSPGRIHYWKVMLWTLFTRPRLLPQAVALSIYAYHFRKVCEQHVFKGACLSYMGLENLEDSKI